MKKETICIIFVVILSALIRLVALDKYPAGLNADEAAIGYNAWSLLETGKDEHGVSWPLVFRSFDDYKPPLYFYLVLPFVKFLGPNIWAVRLPSAILGILSVYLLYLLVKSLFPENKNLPLVSALVLALSPWHIHFSRGGWEVNASLFFILLFLLSLINSYKKIPWLFLFGLSTVAALYTYHSTRIILPLLALGVSIIYFKDTINLFKKTNLKVTLTALLMSLVLVLPLASQLLSKEGQSRFSGVSVFADEGPLWQALEMRRNHPNETFLVKLLHNRYLSYSLRFTENYLSHFSPRFLFIEGDEIARSKVPGVGQSLLILCPFFALGLLILFRLDTKGKQIILFWFLLSPLAAALTFQSPHALRAQNMSVPLSLIIAFGIVSAYSYLSSFSKKLALVFSILFFLCLSYDFGHYLHAYFLHYPKVLPFAWQYGFAQIATTVEKNYDRYDKIIISDRYDQPYILMAFFLKYPPQTLQKELVMTPRDKFGFSTVRQFGKFEFRRVEFNDDRKSKDTLVIAADEWVDEKNIIETILDPAGHPMYRLAKSDN